MIGTERRWLCSLAGFASIRLVQHAASHELWVWYVWADLCAARRSCGAEDIMIPFRSRPQLLYKLHSLFAAGAH